MEGKHGQPRKDPRRGFSSLYTRRFNPARFCRERTVSDEFDSLNALAQANESERAMAHTYLEDWLKNRRE